MGQKHTPMRTCIGCRSNKAKQELIRLVRTPDNEVKVDRRGKLSGRGAYVCSAECLTKVIKGKQLERALNVSIDSQQKSRLEQEINEQT